MEVEAGTPRGEDRAREEAAQARREGVLLLGLLSCLLVYIYAHQRIHPFSVFFSSLAPFFHSLPLFLHPTCAPPPAGDGGKARRTGSRQIGQGREGRESVSKRKREEAPVERRNVSKGRREAAPVKRVSMSQKKERSSAGKKKGSK
jgi:hypothetical protein